MLDEPTTFLDIGPQLETLELVTRLNQERNRTTVTVLHDLNQAACYADRMIVLKQGRIVANGAHKTVLTAERVRTVFGIEAHIIATPESNAPCSRCHTAKARRREL